ncbi:MAG: hypothetical protein AAF629_30205 [Chloroflexota bacterium]
MNIFERLATRWAFRPYNVEPIVNNFQCVFDTCDISQMRESTYQFLRRHLIEERRTALLQTFEDFQTYYEDVRRLGNEMTCNSWVHSKNLVISPLMRREEVLAIYEDQLCLEERYSKLPGTLPQVFYAHYTSAAKVIRGMMEVARVYRNQVVCHYEWQKSDDLAKAEALLRRYGIYLSPENGYPPGTYSGKDLGPFGLRIRKARPLPCLKCPLVPTW